MSLTHYTLTPYIYHLCQCSMFLTIHYILYRALLLTIYASVPCVPQNSLHPVSLTFIYHLCQCSMFLTIHYILYRALLLTIYASVPCVPHNSLHPLSFTFIYHLCQCSMFLTIHYIPITYLSARDRALASCCCSTSQPSFDFVNPAQR